MAEIIPVAEMGEGFDQDGVSQENQIARRISLDGDGAERVQEEAHVSLPMEDLVPNLVSKINENRLVEPKKLKVSSGSISCSIHRVPRNIRQHYNTAYDPQVVSIGPFHYEKRRDQLKAMEEHKWRYLHDILSRNEESSLERHLVVAVKDLVETARSCYAEEIELDSSSFVEMMVLDGCFIFELFRKALSKEYYEDPIFELPWLGQAVFADVQLLENQIPFFILKCLFDRIDPTNSLDLLGKIFEDFGDSHSRETIEESNIQIQHLLHLQQTCKVLSMKEKFPEECTGQTIPCATKLEEAGIKFRKMGNMDVDEFRLDIKFQNGVIEIPPLEVWAKKNVLLLNLVAFEQCYRHCKRYVTAYIHFMDCLIKSGKDVEILCQKGIIMNEMGSEQSVAAFFNNITREMNLFEEEFYLSDVCKEINRYSERALPKL